MNLFEMNMEKQLEKQAPLASRMRPESLEDFVGQEHIVGKNRFLSRSIKSDRISSMIFYGPPGTGKTTLANIIAKETSMNFEELSAVRAGVKDIRQVIEKSEELLKIYSKRTIVFIDEIHRFNKAQQDALLPYVEKGLIILIGATTENPYFEVNKALLSRLTLLELKKLSDEDLKKLLNMALRDKEKGLGEYKVHLEDRALDYLINQSNGDGRFALNSLEISVLSTDKDEDGIIRIDKESLENSLMKKNINYDKDGEEHYNIISAYIKSMRGSDPDAALYWLARMIEAGEDPKFIARRLVIFAAEDIGLADPNALVIADSVFNSISYIGMPEARIILSQGTIYMATAEKSNTAYRAIDRALEDVKNKALEDVPEHLHDSTSKRLKGKKAVKEYKYPHDYDNAYVEQEYMARKVSYYKPKDLGYEKFIKDRLDKLR